MIDELPAGAILLAGHSHLATLIGRPNVPPTEIVRLPNNVFGLQGAWPRASDYFESLEKLSANAHVALVWRGNEHNNWFLIEADDPFDFFLSTSPDDPILDGAPLVPEELVRAQFRLRLPELQECIAALARIAKSISVIGTPPPKSEEFDELAGAQRSRSFVDLVQRKGAALDNVSLRARSVRRKLWQVLQETWAEACVDGVRFIPVPASMLDENGYLPLRYCSGDVSHANRAYGRELLTHIVS